MKKSVAQRLVPKVEPSVKKKRPRVYVNKGAVVQYALFHVNGVKDGMSDP